MSTLNELINDYQNEIYSYMCVKFSLFTTSKFNFSSYDVHITYSYFYIKYTCSACLHYTLIKAFSFVRPFLPFD